MLVAVTMVKSEADVIGSVIRHLFAEGVDHVIAADNMSDDETYGILTDLAREFSMTVMVDDEPGYYQSEKMTRLSKLAGDMGASFVLPFDADEVWFSPDGRTLGEWFAACRFDVVMATGWDYIAQRADDPNVVCPVRRIQHRRSYPQKLSKVAFRPGVDRVVHMGNHDVEGGGSRCGGLALAHFQYRSLGQMTRKLRNGRRAYELTDLHPMHGTHWREGGLLSDVELLDKWNSMLDEQGLVLDPAPLRG